MARSSGTSEEERALLPRYVDAHERADLDALAALLREDARLTMPPHPSWFDGRDAIITAVSKGFEPEFGEMRHVIAGANLQPTVAQYLRAPGESEYRALVIEVLRMEDGLIVDLTSFLLP